MYNIKFTRCLFFVVILSCISLAQKSYFWILDNNTSRIDVGNRGNAPTNPPAAIPANKPSVPQANVNWSVSDFFIPTWQTLSSDFELELEVAPQIDTDSWAPGGLMFVGNKTTNPGANFVIIAVTSQYGMVFNAKVSGPDNHQINYSGPITLPVTIKLTRVGNNLTGYYKDNPEDSWTELGSINIAGGSLVNPDVAKMLFENTNAKEINQLAGGNNGE